MKHTSIAFALMLLILLVFSSSYAYAQLEAPKIYWRQIGEARPGGEFIIVFFYGFLAEEGPRPVSDATYMAFIGRKEMPVKTQDGMAYVKVQVPLEALLGWKVFLNLTASSEMYGTSYSTIASIDIGPDILAILALSSIAIPLVPIILVMRRRWNY